MVQLSRAEPAAAGAQPPPLRLSRVLHAPRETVFKAWSSADHVKRWFSPETFTVPMAKVEMRVGGSFELCMRSAAGEEHWIHGTFAEVVPNSRLVIDMRVANAAGEPLFRAYTEVDFCDALGGTRLDLVQSYTLIDPSTAWMVTGAPEGWRTTLDKLEKEVVRMQGAAATGARSAVHATFSLQRTFDAPVARVWTALTDERAKEKWFAASPGLTVIERRMDVRVDGRERVKGRWEGGVVSTFDAIYHDVIPHQRLIYSYELHLDDKKISVSLATMELRDEGAKTTLTITEQGAFLDGYDDAGSREKGTGYLLDALGASLTV